MFYFNAEVEDLDWETTNDDQREGLWKTADGKREGTWKVADNKREGLW